MGGYEAHERSWSRNLPGQRPYQFHAGVVDFAGEGHGEIDVALGEQLHQADALDALDLGFHLLQDTELLLRLVEADPGGPSQPAGAVGIGDSLRLEKHSLDRRGRRNIRL